uniref:Uncharacterized protein n=1 Tax=Plectus sambesii TaxID=2011161 RepID=A0A914V4T6_9BILA
MVNGGECATVSHCNGSATDAEVADIAARQENVIKRIEQLRAKLDSLLVAQKSGDAKQSSANEKSKNKGDKKEKGKGKGGPVEAQKSDGGAPTIGLLLRAPAEAQSVAPPKGQSIAACAPPTLLDFGNSSASVAEILSADKKIDVTLSIGADDVYWASALLNALTSRQKDVSV